MLGPVCFRLSVRGSGGILAPGTEEASVLSSSSLLTSHHHPHFVYRHSASAKSTNSLNYLLLVRPDRHAPPRKPTSRLLQGVDTSSSLPARMHCHASSCLLAGSGGVGATIWHALLPSFHLCNADRGDTTGSSAQMGTSVKVKNSTQNGIAQPFQSCGAGNFLGQGGEREKDRGGGERRESSAVLVPFAQHPSTLPKVASCGAGLQSLAGATTSMTHSLATAAGLRDGSWNVAWDVRPARWLHGRHSAWLLFGVCGCFSAIAGTPLPNIPSNNSNTLAYAEALPEHTAAEADSVKTLHGKELLTDYTVIGIPGDGRCLFRAVAHGACLRSGKSSSSENIQRELADELRNEVVDELVSRREEVEWFIEGDFDMYVKRMREPHVWGGEPELLMASHVLKVPITVYMSARDSKGIIAIAEYGKQYGDGNPIRVLYHGFGHYDSLQIPGTEVRNAHQALEARIF